MKKHNVVKVVLITMLVFMLLTWIFPSAYYSSEFTSQGRIQMGLFDLFNYPMTAISYFGYIILYVIVVGGFYGVLYKIPAYRSFLEKIANCFKKKGVLSLSIIMILLAVLTSMFSLQLGLILFYPFIISLVLLMGYDKITAALTVVGSTMIGIAGSTLAYENVGVINSILGGKLTDMIFVKIAILIVGIALLIVNTMLYLKNTESSKKSICNNTESKDEKNEAVAITKKTTSKSSNTKKTTGETENKADLVKEEVVVDNKSSESLGKSYLVPKVTKDSHKIWPFVSSFIVLFVILVLAFISWKGSFNADIMEKASSSISEFKIFGFPIFAKLLGTFNPFGQWMITDMFGIMLVALAFLTIIYKVKIDNILDGFADGAKKALLPSFIILLIYTILVICTYHPFQLTIYKFIVDLTSGFNVFTTSIVAILSSLFNGDPVYVFQSVIPYLSGTVTNQEMYPIISVIFQSIYGVTMLIAPTSVVLMGTLSYMGVSYKDWFKAIWKLLVELLVILLVIFTILVLI